MLLGLTLERYQQIQRAKDKDLSDIFTMELNMAMQCVAGPDFREGVRALLVDKDRNPTWQYGSVSEVPAEWIEQHFQPFDLQPN